ncbi:MAG: hypothetical protein AAFV95_21110 [Bacteroidota bacterium]
MNPYTHAELSVRRRGGLIEDYYAIHSFLDSTKELCSDNRHRILHNHWAVRRILIPLFGPALVNSDGKCVNLKDLCEQDHLLADYKNRFIPTLGDFVEAFEELSAEEKQQINRIHGLYEGRKDIQALLMSPLTVTGQLRSLRITHNQWFCNEIIPRLFQVDRQLEELGPVTVFDKMQFRPWMDNGRELPRSAQKIKALI